MAWKMGQSLLGSFLLLLVCSQRFQLTRASWKDNNRHFCMNLTPIHLQQWKAECELVRSPGWRFVITCAISYGVTAVCNCVSEPGSSEKQEWSGTQRPRGHFSLPMCVCEPWDKSETGSLGDVGLTGALGYLKNSFLLGCAKWDGSWVAMYRVLHIMSIAHTSLSRVCWPGQVTKHLCDVEMTGTHWDKGMHTAVEPESSASCLASGVLWQTPRLLLSVCVGPQPENL